MSSSTAARSRSTGSRNDEPGIPRSLQSGTRSFCTSRRASSPRSIPASPSASAACVGDRIDPMIAGLLEGAAFLAARVQLKLKHEFSGVHQQPARAARPELSGADAVGAAGQDRAALFGDPGAARGQPDSRAAPISTRPIASATGGSPAATGSSSDITLWPFDIIGAEYYRAPGPAAGARTRGRAERRRGPAALADAPHGRAPRGRDCRTPRRRRCRKRGSPAAARRAADLSPRQRSRRDRALRAALRALRRRLFPLSRRVRRSGDRAGAEAMPRGRSASTRTRRCCRTTSASSAASTSCASTFMFPRKFLGFRLRQLAADPAAPQGEVGRPHLRLRRGQPAAARRGAAAHVRALRGAGHQPVREDDRPDPVKLEPARIPRRAGPQPLPRLRAAPRARRLRPFPRRPREGAGPSALFGAADASATSAACSTRCAALPRRRSAEERRYGTRVRLHRHRHVHLADRARRRSATSRTSPSSACARSAPTAT